ncbi:hypothetical protein PAXRUDRAFT_270314 [Paxillus rubicundulus Ve08.2h10]|uniref:Uncharacterized protein n=1 Tax=Paxillus rubicundulus Ve08.2h10 TaxID=930991 RepID=A0A0D0DXL5_9AGAM|nr:hypothetical protein PAXRUDRAFT_270314 [Paxillus rubicundulus Ve08.2h10]
MILWLGNCVSVEVTMVVPRLVEPFDGTLLSWLAVDTLLRTCWDAFVVVSDWVNIWKRGGSSLLSEIPDCGSLKALDNRDDDRDLNFLRGGSSEIELPRERDTDGE